MRQKAAFVLTCLLLASVPAAAAPPEDAGRLLTHLPFVVPAGAHVDASWEAAFCGDLQKSDRLWIHAPRARVERHERTRVETGPVIQYVGHATSTYHLTSLNLTMAQASGWLGVDATSSTATLSLTLSGASTLAPAGHQRLGNWKGTAADASDLPAFSHDVETPHLATAVPLAGSMDAAMRLKAYGPSITLDAAENASTVKTGATRSNDAAGGVTKDVWLVVHLDDATASWGVRGPCALALGDATVDAHGSWIVPAARGNVTLDGGERALQGERVELEGALQASVSAVVERDLLVARLDFVGDVSMASLGAEIVRPAHATPSRLPWVLAGAAVVVAGGIAGSAMLRRPRRHEDALTVDQCIEMADMAAEAGRHQSALEWTRRAQAVAPGSVRLKMDEAWFLWEVGDVEQALAACDAAVRMSDDGETAFLAALLSCRAGEPARARAHLLLALRQEPFLALEAQHEPSFRRLRTDPVVADAIEAALRACR